MLTSMEDSTRACEELASQPGRGAMLLLGKAEPASRSGGTIPRCSPHSLTSRPVRQKPVLPSFLNLSRGEPTAENPESRVCLRSHASAVTALWSHRDPDAGTRPAQQHPD